MSIFCLTAVSTYAVKIVNGPYLQLVGEDSATIVWSTDADALSWVEIAPDDGTHFYAKERQKFFNAPMGKKRIGKTHQITVKGLETGKTYNYRVFSREVLKTNSAKVFYGEVASSRVYKKEPFKIKTFKSDADSLKFTVVNDIHSNAKRLEAFLKNCSTDDFILLNGDMSSTMDSPNQIFEGYLNTITKSTYSSLPVFLARGNHESRGEFSEGYLDLFPTPTGKPYYTAKIGKFFFIFLDGGEDKADSDIEYYDTADFDNYRKEQGEWLKAIVDSDEFKNAEKRILVTHIPPAWGEWHGSVHFRKIFAPILKGKKIDVILSGHLHEHVFYKPDENFEAPTIVNSNDEVMRVSVDKNEIRCDFFNEKLEKARDSIVIK